VAAGTGGFVIKGLTTQPNANAGFAVASAGDFNGDGLADLIVGAPGVDVTPPGGTQLIDAGSSFLVYGKTTGTAIELSDVAKGVGGFAINAAQASGLFGLGVSSAGDVNGDGLADLLIGAPGTPGTATSTGTAYIIFGGQDASSKIDFLGTTGKDTLIGTTASETFVGNLGDDILTGNGGADVMYGGAGNDTFVLNADNITKLVNGGVVNGHHALVDGGSGLDTIWLSGTGLTFDLTAIKDAAGVGAPDVSNSLNSIERINLTNFGSNNASNNTLKLSAKDLINLSNFNVFSGVAAVPPNHNHQLMVDGDASSKVILTGSWVNAGLYNFNGNQYDILHTGSNNPVGVAELLVNHLITSVTVL
jgi:hypothetical protein